jgi:hypothetical protein
MLVQSDRITDRKLCVLRCEVPLQHPVRLDRLTEIENSRCHDRGTILVLGGYILFYSCLAAYRSGFMCAVMQWTSAYIMRGKN